MSIDLTAPPGVGTHDFVDGLYTFDLEPLGFPAGYTMKIGSVGGGAFGIQIRSDVGELSALYLTGDPLGQLYVNGHSLALSADGTLTLDGTPLGFASQLYRYQGDWDSGISYFQGDAVRNPTDGLLYVALRAPTVGAQPDVSPLDWTTPLAGDEPVVLKMSIGTAFDPTTGVGAPAPLGSLLLKRAGDSASGELFVKSGTADTGWVAVLATLDSVSAPPVIARRVTLLAAPIAAWAVPAVAAEPPTPLRTIAAAVGSTEARIAVSSIASLAGASIEVDWFDSAAWQVVATVELAATENVSAWGALPAGMDADGSALLRVRGSGGNGIATAILTHISIEVR